jgi:adenylate cyclase
MLHEGRRNTHMREFGDDMCRRVVEAGIPLWRAFCGIRTLHPQIAASAYVWRRGQGTAERRTAMHGAEKTPAFTQSPLAEVTRTGRMIRRRLDDHSVALDYAVLEDFRAEGHRLCCDADVFFERRNQFDQLADGSAGRFHRRGDRGTG